MKTRDRNKSVVHELLKKHQQPSQREAQAPSPSDSCRKRKAGENVAGSLALQQGIFGPEVVGRKIAVYWRKPGEWFKGKIHGYATKTRRHHVKYDDGDQADLDLERERFQFLTNPRPGSAPNRTYHGSPKGKDAVGRKVKVYWPAMGRWYVGKVKGYDTASGKHLIAYQDGEQHEVLLRNEAVRYPGLEGGKPTAAKGQKPQQRQQQPKGKRRKPAATNKGREQQHQSPPASARTLPRGKRVAADCRELREAAESKKRRQDTPTTSSAAECSNAETTTAEGTSSGALGEGASHSSDNESNDSLRGSVQCPKTPEYDELDGNNECGGQHRRRQHRGGARSDLPVELVEVAEAKPCNNNKMVDKVEIAKAKALKAKEIAARKAEEAAKALAAAEAAHKLEERSDKPQGKEAVGWRLRVWSPEEHKYFKGTVIGYNQGSGEHKLQFDDGRVDSVVLDRQRTKWVKKTIPPAEGPTLPPAAPLRGGRPSPQAPPKPKAPLADLSGKHVSVVRGQDRLLGKVVCFSQAKQKYLILYAEESKHEWSDLRRSNWRLAQEDEVRPCSFAPSGQDCVGWRLSVFWPDRERFYQGQCVAYDGALDRHLVRYDEKVIRDQQVWLDFGEVTVKWPARRNDQHQHLGKPKGSGLRKAGAPQGAVSRGEEGRPLEPECAAVAAAHPEVFSHCPETTAHVNQAKLDVLSNIHNAWGLLTPLEELTARNRAARAALHNLPVISVEDVWGVKVVVEEAERERKEELEREERRKRDQRAALASRLQVLEFMLEHSGHAEYVSTAAAARGETLADPQPLLSKEDIQPLEPTVSNVSLENLSFL